MHEAFRKRLQVLEKAAALREAPPHLIGVGFAGVEPTVAWTGDFRCWRREGEDEATFQARAHAEARAADPRPPVQILIFSDLEEILDATEFCFTLAHPVMPLSDCPPHV